VGGGRNKYPKVAQIFCLPYIPLADSFVSSMLDGDRTDTVVRMTAV
jgi:hypothetical protein